MAVDLTFDAPEMMAAFLQGFEADLMITRGHGVSWITRTLSASGIRLQFSRPGAPYVFSGVTWPGSAEILIPLRSTGWRIDGTAFDDAVLLAAPGSFHTAVTTGPVSLVSINIGWEDYQLAWRRVLRRNQTPPETVLPITTELRKKLHDLIHQFEPGSRRVEGKHSLFAHQWKSDLFSLLAAAAEKPGHPARQSRTTCQRIIHRGLDHLMNHPTRAVSIAELCTVTSASERAVRAAFGRTFLMGPTEYVRLRRLHLVHRLLLCPALHSVTITETATRFGFYDLGRFASHYQRVFGEKPSDTLQRRNAGLYIPLLDG